MTGFIAANWPVLLPTGILVAGLVALAVGWLGELERRTRP